MKSRKLFRRKRDVKSSKLRKGCVKSKKNFKEVWLVKKWNTLLVKIDAADQ